MNIFQTRFIFVACFHRLVWISLRFSSGGEFKLYCVMVCTLYLLHYILLFCIVTWQSKVQYEPVACMNGERYDIVHCTLHFCGIIMHAHRVVMKVKLCVLCGVIYRCERM